MKIRNYKKLLSVLLCAVMVFSVLVMASCNNEPEAATDAAQTKETEAPAPMVEVLRFVNNVKAGTAIADGDIETVSLRAVDVPINAMTDKTAVVGKYATSDLFKGDFIFPIKLSATPIVADDNTNDEAVDEEIAYTLITKYASLVTDGDYTAAIKKAIEENPTATIYFPDGEYKISDTIVISADPAKSVSLRLANYATIKAVNWTDKTQPMLRIGVEEEGATPSENIFDVRNVYVSGGVFDGAGIASGISLEGGKDITLSNITIRKTFYGLDIKKAPNELGANNADIENVNVIGTAEAGSIGLIVSGSYNTLTNMKLSDVQYGMKCTETGSNNIFRSIMAVGTSLTGTDNAGFWDLSDGNQYDICYSDQFATGFLISERARSIYNGCAVSWWSADNNYHVGFRAEGKLNSSILYSKVYHDHTVATDAYLIVPTDGGEGIVQYPISQIVSTEYDAVLNKYCKTDILH